MENGHTLTLELVEAILTAADKQIESYLRGEKERFGVTQLSKDVALEMSCTFTLAYAVISDYIERRVDITVEKGRNGGIKKVPMQMTAAQ